MMKPVKIKIGHVMCTTPGCNTRVPVRKNPATGALSFPCIECGAPHFAKNDGSQYYQSILDRMIPAEAPAAATPPAPVARAKDPLFG